MAANDIDRISRDLNEAASQGKLPPFVGRDRELNALLAVLCGDPPRKALIVGEDGVGKKALVRGTVARAKASNPERTIPTIREFNSILLDAKTLLMLESVKRLAQTLKSSPNMVLFVDEIARVFESDDYEHDVRGLLKPVLLTDTAGCIGSLTPDEYQRIEQTSPEYLARFEIIRLEPLSEKETVEVLESLRGGLEAEHKVTIGRTAIRSAAALTREVMSGKHLPGQAIEVLEKACVRYSKKSSMALKTPAAEWMNEESIAELGKEVSRYDVKRVISELTSINVDDAENEWWTRTMIERLRKAVVGQDTAVADLSRAISKLREPYGSPRKPRGVILVFGPKGVGRVHTVATMAKRLLGSLEHVHLLDVRDFADDDSIQDFFGSTPRRGGDPGAGRLADAASLGPLVFIILDRMEKAHPQFLEALAPILVTGKNINPSGAVMKYTNCVFVLSVAVAPNDCTRDGVLARLTGIEGSGSVAAKIVSQADAFVRFNPLAPENARAIIRMRIEQCQRSMPHWRVGVRIHERVYALLIQNGLDEHGGVRRLGPMIERGVLDPLREIAKRRIFGPGETVDFVVRGETIAMKIGNPSKTRGQSGH